MTKHESVTMQAAQVEPSRPDLLEKLTYHALECDDMTLDEVLEVLANGWKKVHGRTERQFLLQLVHLMASAPTTEAQVEPVAWGMRDKSTGLILDVICPDEHESFEGEYTIPLYTTPPASSALVEAAEKAYEALQNSQQYVEASANKKLLDGWGEQLDEAESASIALRAAIEAEKKGQQ